MYTSYTEEMYLVKNAIEVITIILLTLFVKHEPLLYKLRIHFLTVPTSFGFSDIAVILRLLVSLLLLLINPVVGACEVISGTVVSSLLVTQ